MAAETSEKVKNDLHRLARRYAGWSEEIIANNAIALIDQLEEQVMCMQIQMHGDCGVCAHRTENDLGKRTMSQTCYECMQKETRPNWKYEGLPEVKSK